MMILAVAVGSFIGTLAGNLGVFWLIGRAAKNQEKKQREDLQRLQSEFLEMRQKEAERMDRYARMEG
jgi:hypothetical protein